MNIVDKAWEIIQKANPVLTQESFLETLRPTFEENKHLSKAEIKAKMLAKIKKDKPFGETIAKGAEYIENNQPSTEESIAAIEAPDVEDPVKTPQSQRQPLQQ